MDTKTKLQVIISLVLVFLIGLLTYWIQLPADDLKAQVITESPTVLVRIQDFAFIPDVVKIDKGTAVSWLNDETADNSGVQHTVVSYDPEDSTKAGDLFQSGLLSQGDTFTQEFPDEGVYYYNCSLHPFMTGKVCVGESSVDLDPDCDVAITEAEGTLGETVTLPTEEEEEEEEEEEGPPALTLPPTTTVEEDTAADVGTGAEETEQGLPQLEDEETLVLNLQGAADEDYKPYSGTQTAPTYTSGSSYPKTANSGPEDLIYILPALASLFVARKWLANKA